MASYDELRQLFSDDALKMKMDVAVLIAAHNLLVGTPTADQQKWAAQALANPRAESDKAYRFVLAANESASVAAIQGATDAQIQTNVDAVVPALVVAYNAQQV